MAPRNVCVFRGRFVHEQVDPRVQQLWLSKVGRRAPFGDLRRIWRTEHCATVNPYGSDHCPYREEDCALAFYQAVEVSLARATTRPVGYFRRTARSMGLERAENKPLARDAMMPTDGAPPASERDTSDSPGRPPARPEAVRGSVTRPVRIGDLLGALDLGPRPGPSDDGKASTK